MHREWEKIDSKVVYSNPWIKIHEDNVIRPDGEKGIYGYLEKSPGNFIIALDNDHCIYLIKEYRYPLKKVILQLPVGVIETDNIVQQAQKELFEETGILAKNWERLGGFYVAPGHETTYMNVFLATDLNLSKLRTSNQEGDESILEIIKVNLNNVKKMIGNGEIESGMTLAALSLFFLKYDNE